MCVLGSGRSSINTELKEVTILEMRSAFIFSICLHALLYAFCSGEACVGNWSTDTTKFTTLTYKEDSYVYVSCKYAHFKVDGENPIKCVGGQLPTYLPQCVLRKASCSTLKAPEFGSMKCSSGAPEVRSSCAFECQNTHFLRGTSNRICTEDLRWTGSEARCVLKPECSEPPPLLQGTVRGCSPTKRPKYEDTCYFHCNEGFHLVGPSHLKCRLTGKLTDDNGHESVPTCEQSVLVSPILVPALANADLQNRPPTFSPTSWLACHVHNGYCSHHCHQESTGVRCSCRNGYLLQTDGKTCREINSGRGVSRSTARPVSRPSWKSCQVHNRYCSHHCHQEPKGVRCSCDKGYRLASDNRTCVDVNECKDKKFNKCDHLCRNKRGGYECLCIEGYTSPDGFSCEDVNECLDDQLNKCDHVCKNKKGGYICSCREGFVSPDGFKCEGCRVNSYRASTDVSCKECPSNSHTDGEEKTSLEDCVCNPGFTGNAGQGIPCKDIDECADGENFGCSHTCINTPGSALCACPSGYQLKEDGKTCIDIDECSIKNGGCDGICQNTAGNFTCSCPKGYVASPVDRYSCDDVDECAEDNGGCSGECVNFQGGFHCSCPESHHLHPDGKTCIPVYCPRMFVPHHSTLRCKNTTASKNGTTFKHVKILEDMEFPVGAICKIKCDKGYAFHDAQKAIVCQNDGQWNASLPECQVMQCPPLSPPLNGDVYPPSCKNGSSTVKQKCIYTCLPGYRITGQEMLTCRNNLTWAKKKPTLCVPETEVSISCPDDDLTVELGSDEAWAELQLNSPRTTLTAGPIQVSPEWVHLGQPSIFPAGETEVTFSVTSGNSTAECSIFVVVLDKHPPVFSDCPDTLSVTASLAGTEVNWEEPVPEDNVGVASVSKSLEPNSTLSPGLHFVEYVARDFAGNVGQCIFYINVTATGGCSDLADPENGEANCQEWMFGKICQPTCFENYTRPAELFACDDSGTWSPADFISPCLPE